MCQRIRLGLPKLLEHLSGNQIKPFTAEECPLAYRPPSPEFDALEHRFASLSKSLTRPKRRLSFRLIELSLSAE
jgi:hypothetical protein